MRIAILVGLRNLGTIEGALKSNALSYQRLTLNQPWGLGTVQAVSLDRIIMEGHDAPVSVQLRGAEPEDQERIHSSKWSQWISRCQHSPLRLDLLMSLAPRCLLAFTAVVGRILILI